MIHQDYADQGRKAVIKFFKDGILFWNPGDVFGRYKDLLEPGEKEVRNPMIANTFRRISLCERAGTGLRMVIRNWTRIGNPVPIYQDDKSNKSFESVLPYMESDDPDNVHSVYSVHSALNPEEKHILEYCRVERSMKEIMIETGNKNKNRFIKNIIDPLLVRDLLERKFRNANAPNQKYSTTPLGLSLL